MATRPAISVITPTYNRRPALERAIRSVQRQTFDDYEHIIVDDCSRDETECFVQSLGDPRIRYIRFARWQGANPARNCGIREARASVLTFLDSDDEFLPHRLETTFNRCAARPDVQMLISSFRTLKRGRACDAVNPGVYLPGPHLERALMASIVYIAGSSITVQREPLLRAGGFAPALQRLQDREMLLRFSQHGGALLLPEIDWVKHRSPDSISSPRRGYVEALGALLKAHPGLAGHYRQLLTYHISRHVLADLLRGRVIQSLASWKANRRASQLRIGFWQLIRGYRTGRGLRRTLAAELSQRARQHAGPPACEAPSLSIGDDTHNPPGTAPRHAA